MRGVRWNALCWPPLTSTISANFRHASTLRSFPPSREGMPFAPVNSCTVTSCNRKTRSWASHRSCRPAGAPDEQWRANCGCVSVPRRALSRALASTGRSGLRSSGSRLERNVRQPAGIDRPLPRRKRRTAPFIFNILSHWTKVSEDAANIAWTRRLFANLRPWMKAGVYVNFMSGDEDEEERAPEAYRDRWERLREIKTKYDPQNLFRLNQNIPPYGSTGE